MNSSDPLSRAGYRGGPSRPPSGRVFGLDCLRALAIFNVVYLHAYGFIGNLLPVYLYSAPVVADGVLLFFVLSGFLVGRILIESLEDAEHPFLSLTVFWKRRWFRTLPNYYLLLLLGSCVSGFTFDQLTHQLPKYAFFLQNIAWPHPNFINEAWSLAVEEIFYITIPIALVLTRKITSTKRALLFVSISIILGVWALRIWRYNHTGPLAPRDWDLIYRRQVVMQLDSIMIGVSAAWLSLYRHDLWEKMICTGWWIGLSLLAAVKIYNNLTQSESYGAFRSVFYFPIAAFGTAAMLPGLCALRPRSTALVRIVTFVSSISYSVYVINFSFISNWLMPRLQDQLPLFRNPIAAYLTFWGLTFVTAYLLYILYEKPMTSIRDRAQPKVPN